MIILNRKQYPDSPRDMDYFSFNAMSLDMAKLILVDL